MPKAGFEPAQVSPPPPQDGVSANSTTSALNIIDCLAEQAIFLQSLQEPLFEKSLLTNILYGCINMQVQGL